MLHFPSRSFTPKKNLNPGTGPQKSITLLPYLSQGPNEFSGVKYSVLFRVGFFYFHLCNEGTVIGAPEFY